MSSKSDTIGYVGVPAVKGQPRLGTELGPSNLRERGLVRIIQNYSHKEVVDYGDLVFEEFENDPMEKCIKNPLAVGNACGLTSQMCQKATRENKLSVFIGGDHSMAVGSIHGHLQTNPDACLLWIDAHADFNVPQESPTSNSHGMVMSLFVNECRKYLNLPESFNWLTPCMPSERVAFIGYRDLDECESFFSQTTQTAVFSMQEVEKYGIAKVLNMALDHINPNRDRPIHVSWDIDSIDPTFIPSTGTPIPHGLTMREALYLAEELNNTNLVTAIDFVEFNPRIGTPEQVEQTANNVIDVIRHFFGRKRAGVFRPTYTPRYLH